MLPVLAPELSYDGLDFADGTEAQVVWEAMLDADQDERRQLEDGLREYCRLDTMAMVRMLEHLRDVLRA